MDVNQLEDEYTPSLFSKRFDNREKLFEHYTKFTGEGEKEISIKVKISFNYLSFCQFKQIS